MKYFYIICLLSFTNMAYADGSMFNSDGRLSSGKVTEIVLTQYQIELIDYWYQCRALQDDIQTPYFFYLSNKQRLLLESDSGADLLRFTISSSYNQDDGAELGTNVINRYSKTKAEIPHLFLTDQKEFEHWEENIIGWELESKFIGLSEKELAQGCI